MLLQDVELKPHTFSQSEVICVNVLVFDVPKYLKDLLSVCGLPLREKFLRIEPYFRHKDVLNSVKIFFSYAHSLESVRLDVEVDVQYQLLQLLDVRQVEPPLQQRFRAGEYP